MLKKLMHSLAKRLNKKGESFVESLCSIIVFSILVLAITVIINAAMQITMRAITAGNAVQQTLNEIVNGDFTGATTAETTFKITGMPRDVDININQHTKNKFMVFEPKI